MTKEEVLRNRRFIRACIKFGLDPHNCKVYDDVILLFTKTEDLYVFMNKDFDIIGVQNNFQDVCEEEFVMNFYEEYSQRKDIIYPFSKYTLKNLIELSNKIDIIPEHGYPEIGINGTWILSDAKEDEKYKDLLLYVKFLDEMIYRYFQEYYHMSSLGWGQSMPNVYEYVRSIMDILNYCVKYCNNKNDVMDYLGVNMIQDEFVASLLYGVVAAIKSHQTDLKPLANDLLKILKEQKKSQENSFDYNVTHETIGEILTNLGNDSKLTREK